MSAEITIKSYSHRQKKPDDKVLWENLFYIITLASFKEVKKAKMAEFREQSLVSEILHVIMRWKIIYFNFNVSAKITK